MKKVVIYGTGSIGMKHAQIIRDLGHLPILIPTRSSRSDELNQLGWGTAENLASIPPAEREFLIICTNTSRHIPDVLDADKLGFKNILAEKPLGSSAADIEQLSAQLSKESLSGLRVACLLRFHSAILTFKNLLPKIGSQHSVNIFCRSYLPDWRPNRNYKETYSASASEGGVIRDMVHEIDYCNFLFGLDISGATCVKSIGSTLEIESTANAVISWKSADVIYNIQLDYLTRKTQRGIQAYGSNGELYCDLIANEVTFIDTDCNETKEQLDFSNPQAMSGMLESFLNQDGLGCNYTESLESAQLIDQCEN